jgi:site-specific DNA-methyltransferase (adenine-specific)
MYDDLVKSRDVGEENEFPPELADVVINGNSKQMPLPDNCVQLVVTSPPYNASKDYDEDLSLSDYLGLLHDVFAECYRVLSPGGRMVVNVANLGRKPYIPLASHINLIMHEIGFLHRGEIIWDKSASAGSSCAWGSFQSASNPCLRDIHEYLLVFSKGDYKLARSKVERAEGRIDTIVKDEFIQHTKSIWSFPTESARRVNHPAPFPVELPRRCIEMFTFAGDVVLDPFLGSGTTAVAAKMCGRRYVGLDLSEEYCAIAEERLAQTDAWVAPVIESP